LASRIWLAGAIIVFAIAGCASARQGIGDNLTVEKIDTLRIGKTNSTQVKALFGKPDITNNLKSGEVEYTYLQGRSDSTSWQIVPGYRIYGTAEGLAGSVILLMRFKEGVLDFFMATDGKLTIKKERDKNSSIPEKKEEGK